MKVAVYSALSKIVGPVGIMQPKINISLAAADHKRISFAHAFCFTKMNAWTGRNGRGRFSVEVGFELLLVKFYSNGSRREFLGLSGEKEGKSVSSRDTRAAMGTDK